MPPRAGAGSWSGASPCPRPGDPVRWAKAKVPEGVGFPTKPKPAIALREPAWVPGCRGAGRSGEAPFLRETIEGNAPPSPRARKRPRVDDWREPGGRAQV